MSDDGLTCKRQQVGTHCVEVYRKNSADAVTYKEKQRATKASKAENTLGYI